MVIDVSFTVQPITVCKHAIIPVRHIYSSSQVERFKLYGRHGEIVMEKRLLYPVRSRWKFICGRIYAKEKHRKLVGTLLAEIVQGIELYLKDRDPLMTEGHVTPTPYKRQQSQSTINKNRDNGKDVW